VDPLGGWTVTIGDTAREGLPPPPVTARRRCLLRILRDLDHHVACEVQGAERRDLHGRDEPRQSICHRPASSASHQHLRLPTPRWNSRSGRSPPRWLRPCRGRPR